jgi:hypothetical protein
MARDPGKRRSVMASVPEARKIHEVVKRHTFPRTVKPKFEVNFGEDSSGQRAVWIWFFVDEDLKPSEAKISELTNFVSSVRSDLLNADLAFWPYVDVRTENPDEKRS